MDAAGGGGAPAGGGAAPAGGGAAPAGGGAASAGGAASVAGFLLGTSTGVGVVDEASHGFHQVTLGVVVVGGGVGTT